LNPPFNKKYGSVLAGFFEKVCKPGGNQLKIPLLDLKKQYQEIEEEIMAAATEVIREQRFILGPNVETLETMVAEYCQCRYAVGVSSGTDALLISLMAAGIGQDDWVITTPYTFFATAGAIARVGARPVFVDIDQDTYNMSPDELDRALSSFTVEERSRVKALIPVHLFGQVAEMAPIVQQAEKHGLIIIEDAAQAIGAEYEFSPGGVKRAGSMGDYGCFSFFPSKNLGAYGDAGLVTTNEGEIFERLRIMRAHGAKPKYFHSAIGGNFRMDALQAAILLVKLKYLDGWTLKRRENADFYRRLFAEMHIEGVTLPREVQKRHIYNQFVIKLERGRDELRAYLTENGIGSEVYYPVPLHAQSCFSYLGYQPNDFPVSVDSAQRTLALPIYPELSRDQMTYVVEIISQFFKKQ
jgi:dTDP-4-amino-4,6-dideoxygalactose transaminase